LAAIAKKKCETLFFKTVVGTVISKPYKKIISEVLGDIVEANSILIATIRF
jgi:hypothetical protein